MSQDNNVDAIIKGLREYIERLNKALESELPKEKDQVKKQYKDIIDLAGELNAYFTKQ